MATIKIYLKKKQNTNKLHTISLRITKSRKSKLISLGMETAIEEWDDERLQFKRNHRNFSQRNRVLSQLEEKAYQIIDQFAMDEIDWTLKQFELVFKGKSLDSQTVSQFWLEKIADLKKAGRIGNAKAYSDTYRSFFKFSKNKSLTFKEINVALLEKYETFLRSTGSQDGGIGVRMRELRALYNDAINKGVVKQQYYPFRIFKASKFKGSGTKQALTKEEIKLFESLEVGLYPELENAYYYFLFSYYARGMNFQDMVTLKWTDIIGNRIDYRRAKTKTRFTILISEPMIKILKHFKLITGNSTYVFPILLKDNMTPKQIAHRKHKVLKRYNSRLKKIAEIQGISKHITSYVARHSFATNLKFSGVSTDKISQLMGHSDIKVTQAYLREFGDDELDAAVDKLLEESQLAYHH